MRDITPEDVHFAPGRLPQGGIPEAKADRDRLLSVVREYVAARDLVPPLTLAEFCGHASQVVEMAGLKENARDYTAVLLSNEVWRDTVAAVPYDRRLLLLPQCLRPSEECPAQTDEFGLLCAQCGRCPIGSLQAEAERLGYVVLIAEGTAVVTSLVAAGQIDAIIGVRCLSVLERVFPAMEACVIPGVAIPLLYDGCTETLADLDWVWDAVRMNGNGSAGRGYRRMDMDALREEVAGWFERGALEEVLGRPRCRTEEIALDWLGKSGKRWRPFLAVCVFQALQQPGEPMPEDLRRIAVAVECFHKASLVHDDIEDNDAERYGERTLHEEYGTAIAINVGDLLVGEGYRLICETDAPPERKALMLKIAADAHRTLCVGQGEELNWRRQPLPMPVEHVIDIFRKKTAPAFEVALHLGAVLAGTDEETRSILNDYSEALGIAYQIRDDLADAELGCGDAARTPSLQLGIAWETATGEAKLLLETIWRQGCDLASHAGTIQAIFAGANVEDTAQQLLRTYKGAAVRSLRPLTNATLKALLRRIVGRIFDDIEAGERPNDIEAGDAVGRDFGSETVA